MAIVKTGKGRAVVENGTAGLRITVPARTRIDVTVFLGLWLIFWILGGVLVVHELLVGRLAHGAAGGAIIWLLFWIVMSAVAFHWLLWQLTGKEIIDLTSTSLRQRKEIPLFSRSREFAVPSITNLRLAPPPSWFRRLGYRMPGLDFKEGVISFDYCRGTYHLAQGLEEADAQHVISEMCKHVTSLCR